MKLKLVSPKDTLLGHIDVPNYWNGGLDRAGCVSVPFLPPLRIACSKFSGMEMDVPVEVSTIVIMRAGWSQYRGAVYLARGTIEELEALRDCSFSPSAAYLRSIVDA